MACAQCADWIPKAFDDRIENAFIVQEIIIEMVIDDNENITHYYEAWEVINGTCNKNEYQESHDLFCIGHPLDDSDALKSSIGHKGKVVFKPRVFLVYENNVLYSKISHWPTNVVREANGLHACYYNKELEKELEKCQEFYRDDFYHEWEMIDLNKIYVEVLGYCQLMFHRDNKNDKSNFFMTINDFFQEEKYAPIKEKIINAWENS
jgi:hypothetical protein